MPQFEHRIKVTVLKIAEENVTEFLKDRERTGSRSKYRGAKVEMIIPSDLRAEELEAAVKDNVFELCSECVVSYSPSPVITNAAIQALLYLRSESFDLTISNHWIGVEGTKKLSTILDRCPDLRTLNLPANNNIGVAGVIALAAKLSECQNLHTLNLSANNIGNAGAKNLAAKLPEYQNLHTLNLSWNIMQDAGAIALAAKLPECQNLHTFDLSNNQNIRDEGLAHLARALYITNELRKGTEVEPLNILGVALPTLTLEEKTEANSEVLIMRTERLQMASPSTAPTNPTSLSATATASASASQ